MQSIESLQDLVASRIDKEAGLIGATEPGNLYQPIKYTLSMGGKRLRPVMTLMACDMFGGETEDAINLALAIEIFHNFTLIHDDIMDKADMRRNRPSVHKKYNENIAILSGDAMAGLAYKYLFRVQTGKTDQIIKLFSQTALEIYEGQQYDMDFEKRSDVRIEEYMQMIRLKTAVLIACSLKGGALAANAPEEDANHLYEFGINLGLAFQLCDDLLDVFADQEKFGKKTGGDIVANKKTFLLIKAMELAAPEQRERLDKWISQPQFNPEEKIEAIKKLYLETRVKQATEEMMGMLYQKALLAMQTIGIKEDRKKELLLLAGQMMKRDK